MYSLKVPLRDLAESKNRAHNLCRSQASKTEGSESSTDCVRGGWTVSIANSQDNGRIQRHKKMALLRGSFTDEKERDKDWRGSTLDHTRRRVCSRVLSCKPSEFDWTQQTATDLLCAICWENIWHTYHISSSPYYSEDIHTKITLSLKGVMNQD